MHVISYLYSWLILDEFYSHRHPFGFCLLNISDVYTSVNCNLTPFIFLQSAVRKVALRTGKVPRFTQCIRFISTSFCERYRVSFPWSRPWYLRFSVQSSHVVLFEIWCPILLINQITVILINLLCQITTLWLVPTSPYTILLTLHRACAYLCIVSVHFRGVSVYR